MVVFDNLARILQKILESSFVPSELVSNPDSSPSHVLEQWKLLGQEAKNLITVGWIGINQNSEETYTYIGIYHPITNKLQVVNKIQETPNIIQASVNGERTLVSYVVKENFKGSNFYRHYVEPIKVSASYKILEEKKSNLKCLNFRENKQIMTNFLEATFKDVSKLLVLIHFESVILYRLKLEENEKLLIVKNDTIAKSFIWAQWDCEIQALYFIHYRKSFVSDENDETTKEEQDLPTLSCFQFHLNLPHETVLNVPLNLPGTIRSTDMSCKIYEDDPVPLRVHDCSLDLIIVSDGKGTICICHHYLYEPAKPLSAGNLEERTVHFAYSVTLLHHGCVIHGAIPGIPWSSAKTIRPVFALMGEQYLMVYAAGIFTHLLDIGLVHEPNCHILMSGILSTISANVSRLIAIEAEFPKTTCPDKNGAGLTPIVMMDLTTMDLIDFEIKIDDLMASLAKDNCVNNRLSILHYFLIHSNDFSNAEEALLILCKDPTDINLPKFFKEILIGGTYKLVRNNMPTEINSFENLLPMTCLEPSTSTERKINRVTCIIKQEILWNTAVMLLSPQQRLKPFITDIWRKLWDRLVKPMRNLRFKPNHAVEKLLISFGCYQPEALPGCSTPSSPGTRRESTVFNTGTFNLGSSRKKSSFDLPFIEEDTCTAIQQEHIKSIYMRELSLHLLKNCLQKHLVLVHSVATQYVSAQLEISKRLCHVIVKFSGVDDITKRDKGFSLIKTLHPNQRHLLFTYFQRYFNAVNSLAYPFPQGFTSFFCYLGFNSLSFEHFMMYLENNVFELQMDVMKEVMRDIDDTNEGVNKKLRLLLHVPKPQAKILLCNWPHGVSLMIRAREHALNVLSGVKSVPFQGFLQPRRTFLKCKGLAAFPSADKGLSPLDTFLDLLTAKASLTDLDFDLLIEATVLSTQDSFYR